MKITEFKQYEARHVLLESLDKESKNRYLVWENVGYQLKEAALKSTTDTRFICYNRKNCH